MFDCVGVYDKIEKVYMIYKKYKSYILRLEVDYVGRRFICG